MEIIEFTDETFEAAVQKAAAALAAGEIIVYPTDTLYGLGADATNPVAVQRLRDLKGRNENQPISVIVSDIEAIERCAEVNRGARAFIEKFLPGALTLELPVKSGMLDGFAKNGNIAVRIPDNKFSLALARVFGKPFTATSANKTGLQTEKDLREILQQFGEDAEKIALAVEDGERSNTLPSTMISFVTDTPTILRDGALSREALGL